MADILMRRSAYDRGKLATDQYSTRCQTMISCDISMWRSVWETDFMRRMNTALGDNGLIQRGSVHQKHFPYFLVDIWPSGKGSCDIFCVYPSCRSCQIDTNWLGWTWYSYILKPNNKRFSNCCHYTLGVALTYITHSTRLGKSAPPHQTI